MAFVPEEPLLSVVIASRGGRGLEASLEALAGTGVEILIAEPAAGEESAPGDPSTRPARVIRCSGSALVPELWGAGIRAARGRYVALTTAEFVLGGEWLAAAREIALANEWAAVGGPIDGPAGAAGSDWAVYFTRYSAFMPPVADSETIVDIAGDNALYRKKDLETHWRDRGFWEVTFHRALRTEGVMPRMRAALTSRYVGGIPPAQFVTARFQHGRHYGRTRPGGSAQRVLRAITAPLLVPLLWWRIARRVISKRRDLLGKLAGASFWVAAFLLAWTAGEALGYLSPRNHD